MPGRRQPSAAGEPVSKEKNEPSTAAASSLATPRQQGARPLHEVEPFTPKVDRSGAQTPSPSPSQPSTSRDRLASGRGFEPASPMDPAALATPSSSRQRLSGSAKAFESPSKSPSSHLSVPPVGTAVTPNSYEEELLRQIVIKAERLIHHDLRLAPAPLCFSLMMPFAMLTQNRTIAELSDGDAQLVLHALQLTQNLTVETDVITGATWVGALLEPERRRATNATLVVTIPHYLQPQDGERASGDARNADQPPHQQHQRHNYPSALLLATSEDVQAALQPLTGQPIAAVWTAPPPRCPNGGSTSCRSSRAASIGTPLPPSAEGEEGVATRGDVIYRQWCIGFVCGAAAVAARQDFEAATLRLAQGGSACCSPSTSPRRLELTTSVATFFTLAPMQTSRQMQRRIDRCHPFLGLVSMPVEQRHAHLVGCRLYRSTHKQHALHQRQQLVGAEAVQDALYFYRLYYSHPQEDDLAHYATDPGINGEPVQRPDEEHPLQLPRVRVGTSRTITVSCNPDGSVRGLLVAQPPARSKSQGARPRRTMMAEPTTSASRKAVRAVRPKSRRTSSAAPVATVSDSRPSSKQNEPVVPAVAVPSLPPPINTRPTFRTPQQSPRSWAAIVQSIPMATPPGLSAAKRLGEQHALQHSAAAAQPHHSGEDQPSLPSSAVSRNTEGVSGGEEGGAVENQRSASPNKQATASLARRRRSHNPYEPLPTSSAGSPLPCHSGASPTSSAPDGEFVHSSSDVNRIATTATAAAAADAPGDRSDNAKKRSSKKAGRGKRINLFAVS